MYMYTVFNARMYSVAVCIVIIVDVVNVVHAVHCVQLQFFVLHARLVHFPFTAWHL